MIYYVDLVVRTGLTLEQAVAEAVERDTVRKAAGIDQAALDEAARQGFANGAFEELEEDVPAVVEEFYPPAEGEQAPQHKTINTTDLREKLEAKTVQLPAQRKTA